MVMIIIFLDVKSIEESRKCMQVGSFNVSITILYSKHGYTIQLFATLSAREICAFSKE